MGAWRNAVNQRDRLFDFYLESFAGGKVEAQQRELLDKAFPNEAELNVLQSGIKQISRAELLTHDSSYLEGFLSFINDTNYMKLFGLPDDLRDALQVLMCERTYLIQLVKGVLEKLIGNREQRVKPKFFNDQFLEQAYE